MKKLINEPSVLVDQLCEGLVLAHPDLLALDAKRRVVTRAAPRRDKVVLISGGGSGHEPAHAGLVGPGLLDAAVCGDVFASPSTAQVYAAIGATRSDKGTLLVVKNYSGDCMNFDAAAEMAEDDDIEVARVYVNDDVAVKDSLYTVGRRGVAGTVFVHKIAGAAAEEGRSLAEVKAVAEKVIANVRSLGVALGSCTVPAKGTPTFALAEDEIEFGVGIHGEPGVAKQKLKSADELAGLMLDRIVADLPFSRGQKVALLVNGFGATPLQELYVLARAAILRLKAEGLELHDCLVGNYMTSLDMAGASLSLLRLDAETERLLDAPADSPALKRFRRAGGGK